MVILLNDSPLTVQATLKRLTYQEGQQGLAVGALSGITLVDEDRDALIQSLTITLNNSRESSEILVVDTSPITPGGGLIDAGSSITFTNTSSLQNYQVKRKPSCKLLFCMAIKYQAGAAVGQIHQDWPSRIAWGHGTCFWVYESHRYDMNLYVIKRYTHSECSLPCAACPLTASFNITHTTYCFLIESAQFSAIHLCDWRGGAPWSARDHRVCIRWCLLRLSVTVSGCCDPQQQSA